MKKIIFIFTLFVFINTTFAEAVKTQPSPEISVMTFNVENLFDTTHDKGTFDHTYLPLKKKKKDKSVQKACENVRGSFYQKQCYELDWNDDILAFKLKQISELIRATNDGQGADNILFAEVENIKVLKRLNQKYLKDLGYKTVVLIEGPDTRGIDVAFMSKFKQVGKAQLHLVPYQDENSEKLKVAQKSRGILEVTVLAPNQKNITFLAAHFPSQSNPTEWRSQAVQFAKSLLEKYQAEGRAVVFGGDLNIIATEEAKHSYFKNILSTVGDISHLVGCKTCLGTHNYKGDWSFLDVLVFSKNLKSVGFELLPDSIQLIKTPLNTDEKGIPIRFDEEKKVGVSDHLPVFAKIKCM